MTSVVSWSVQVSNPSSPMMRLFYKKVKSCHWLWSVTANFPEHSLFLSTFSINKKFRCYISYYVLGHTQVSECKLLKDMMMLVMVALRSKELCPRKPLLLLELCSGRPLQFCHLQKVYFIFVFTFSLMNTLKKLWFFFFFSSNTHKTRTNWIWVGFLCSLFIPLQHLIPLFETCSKLKLFLCREWEL